MGDINLGTKINNLDEIVSKATEALGKLTVKEITGYTVDSTYITNSDNIHIYQQGGMVLVNFNFNVGTEIPTNTQIIKNLPFKPKDAFHGILINNAGVASRIRILSNANYITSDGLISTGWINGQLIIII